VPGFSTGAVEIPVESLFGFRNSVEIELKAANHRLSVGRDNSFVQASLREGARWQDPLHSMQRTR
jgi:hypothetical protein